MIRAFTDGACRSNGKANAQAGYAGYFPENREWSFATKMPENELQTNQRAEMKAIHDSVKIASEKCSAVSETAIEIYTDSMYSKNCLTTWIPNWIKNKWKTAEGNDVKHRDLIEPTYNLLGMFKQYTIVYVKAHTGKDDELSKNNDIVDKMAVSVLIGVPDLKVISTTQNVMPDLPLTMMGPPVDEIKIVEWCKTHLELLDQSSLKTGLFTAFQKTIKKNGYAVEVQRVNKTKVVRLISANSLVKEGITIIKQ